MTWIRWSVSIFCISPFFSLKSEWQQVPLVSRFLQSILAAFVWMVSILLIFSSSWLFSRILATVPRVPATGAITDACMFHSFFNSLARSRYLIFLFPFIFTLGSARRVKSSRLYYLRFFLINAWCWSSGRN